MADDQITKNDGSVITGQIMGVADGQVTVQGPTYRGGWQGPINPSRGGLNSGPR